MPDITIEGLRTYSVVQHTCATWRYEAFFSGGALTLEDSYGHLAKITTQGDLLSIALVARVDGELAGIVCWSARRSIHCTTSLSGSPVFMSILQSADRVSPDA